MRTAIKDNIPNESWLAALRQWLYLCLYLSLSVCFRLGVWSSCMPHSLAVVASCPGLAFPTAALHLVLIGIACLSLSLCPLTCRPFRVRTTYIIEKAFIVSAYSAGAWFLASFSWIFSDRQQHQSTTGTSLPWWCLL